MPQAAMELKLQRRKGTLHDKLVMQCALTTWSAARHRARGCTTTRLAPEAQRDIPSAHPAETAAIPPEAGPHKGKRIGIPTAGNSLALERS